MGRTHRRTARALVVGSCDDETIAWCDALRLWGFDAIATADVERALCSVAELKPVAVVVDLAMPGCDPLCLVAALRSHGPTRHIGIIAVTNELTPDVAELAIGRGCDVVLARPIDVDELAAEVERVSGRRRNQQRAA
ncbi:MAG: response regulator [Myxococcota bacterium]|nr:response regulator [Myxococcota bacterium]